MADQEEEKLTAQCAFALQAECVEACAAYGWEEKGCTGYHPYCTRGKFYIAFKKHQGT